jgi:hypothetical protein
MLLARARGFAYGDAFRDLIGGLQVRETFDVDPEERLGMESPATAAVSTPPATPDPLLADVVDATSVETPAEGAPCCGKPHKPSEPCPPPDLQLKPEQTPKGGKR